MASREITIPKPIISSPKDIQYVRGWGYHDQLGTLDTDAPHVLPSQSSLPSGVSEVREQEYTRAGFLPGGDHASCYLYRLNPGPSWIQDGIRAVSQEEIAPGWVTGVAQNPIGSHGAVPRKFQALSPESQNPLRALKTLFYNNDINIGCSTGSEAMPYFFRNADGDDLFFVHEGTGVCETELGLLGYEKGHYLWIPKGIAYRFVPSSGPHCLFHLENYGEKFQKPDTGFTGDAAVFYHRNIEVPKAHFVDQKGNYQIVVKLQGQFTSFIHSHHPMDVVGWDGTLFPFRLHIRDIKPITSWRAHLSPSSYCTFFGNNFEVCSFVPRPVETGKNSLPVPFDHINIDRDEVIFYSEGIFFSKKDSPKGSFTFHPRGFSHGPHPSALAREIERREKQGAFHFEGYFLLVETTQPLVPTKFASTVEDRNYSNSWQ